MSTTTAPTAMRLTGRVVWIDQGVLHVPVNRETLDNLAELVADPENQTGTVVYNRLVLDESQVLAARALLAEAGAR